MEEKAKMKLKNRKINAFGKSIPAIAVIAMVLTAGIAGAALVGYLSNVKTKQVSVESPIELSGEITYKYMTPAWTEISDGVDVGLATDGDFLYMAFDVDEEPETFLLVFMDTKEGGVPGGDFGGADYMIVDPFVNDNAFGGWYLGKWQTAEERIAAGASEDAVPGWSEPYDYAMELNRPWTAWDCENFEASEGRNEQFQDTAGRHRIQ